MYCLRNEYGLEKLLPLPLVLEYECINLSSATGTRFRLLPCLRAWLKLPAKDLLRLWDYHAMGYGICTAKKRLVQIINDYSRHTGGKGILKERYNSHLWLSVSAGGVPDKYVHIHNLRIKDVAVYEKELGKAHALEHWLDQGYTTAWDTPELRIWLGHTLTATVTFDVDTTWDKRHRYAKNTYSKRRVIFKDVVKGVVTTVFTYQVCTFHPGFLKKAVIAYGVNIHNPSYLQEAIEYSKIIMLRKTALSLIAGKAIV